MIGLFCSSEHTAPMELIFVIGFGGYKQIALLELITRTMLLYRHRKT